MPDYKAPVGDMLYLLNEVFNAEENVFSQIPQYNEVSNDLVRSVLEEAGRFCAGVLRPINISGDKEGADFKDGKVTTPKGFKEAYASYAEGGWSSLAFSPKYEGQGLPRTLQVLVKEMISSANLSFGLFPGLTEGAADAIEAHASEELKQKYLPNMVSGKWTGAMGLTEGGAGSDLSLVKTTAKARDDGSYSISGSKIFISSGDHDLAENVIHLVLARLPDAPAGTKGISLFLCPKIFVNEDGSLGAPNTLGVGSIEHKMGIHAQPTCVMNFDEAQGWLVGEPNRGLNAMFTMMNAARLLVGMQGLGIAEASYQTASAYAKDRLQGRAPGARETGSIIEHPDVRRQLLTMLGFIEAGRALAVYVALELDKEGFHPDAAVRARASNLVALLTPVIKAGLTDFGFETAVLGQQTLGGHGYIHEWGQEQFVRDARITQIYEGTNGIQSQDLVTRKLPLDGGKVVADFFGQIGNVIAEGKGVAEVLSLATQLEAALAELQKITLRLQSGDLANPLEQNAAATAYLRAFTLVTFGWLWLRMALITVKKGAAATPHDKRKLLVGEFFARRMLPQVYGLFHEIEAGSTTLMALASAEF